MVSLLLAGHVSDWYGRRAVMIPALVIAIAASIVFITWHSLAAISSARMLTGIALGATVATATAYLSDLDTGPAGVPTRRSAIVATVANVGGIAIGPLIAGVLATSAANPLTLPFVVFAAAVAIGLLGIAVSTEGHRPVRPRPPYHPQRLIVPTRTRDQFIAAMAGAFVSFAVFGLFAGLAATLLGESFHHASPALAGLAIFLTFGSGLLAQVATFNWHAHRAIAAGIAPALVGLCIVVVSAWTTTPSLAAFLIGGAITGIGCNGIFRGSLSIVIATSDADSRAGALAAFFTAGYAGVSLPVLGAGIALRFLSPRVTLLIFGAAAGIGMLAASRILVRRSQSPHDRPPKAAELIGGT